MRSESAPLTIHQAHLDRFADLSGDDNPIHVDPAFAATTAFQLPVAHGMFLFSLVRAEVRRRWPSARLVEQRLMFPDPTPVGARVRVVLEEQPGSPLCVAVSVVHADGTVGLAGESVLALDEAS